MTMSIYEINNVCIHDVMNKEHQSNNTDGGKEKYNQRHYVHHKFNMNWPGIAPRPPR